MFNELVTLTPEEAARKVAAVAVVSRKLREFEKQAADGILGQAGDAIKGYAGQAGQALGHAADRVMALDPLYTAGAGALAAGGLSAANEMQRPKRRRDWTNPVLAGLLGAGVGVAVPTAMDGLSNITDINYAPNTPKPPSNIIERAIDTGSRAGEKVNDTIRQFTSPERPEVGVDTFKGTIGGGAAGGVANKVLRDHNALNKGYETVVSDPTKYQGVPQFKDVHNTAGKPKGLWRSPAAPKLRAIGRNSGAKGNWSSLLIPLLLGAGVDASNYLNSSAK